ncbi:hypothetical protein [Nocardia sp. NPDC020380]|uniref:hypothetical protein n=1 Tax=Nocardia sp. NPDC020380 TaxID=3364309 RepID=UPI0037B4B0B0
MPKAPVTLDLPGRPRRADVLCAAGAALLVAAAFLIPLFMGKRWRDHLYAGAAPIFGDWLPHIGWGTGPAIAIALGVVAYGPTAAARLPWRRLLLVTWLTALAWAFALAMVDGWQRGFAGRLTTRDEYLHEVGGVQDIGAMLRGFSGRILDFQPDSWTTHVSGHPPGALLVFVLMDRIGLGGGAWAAVLCTVVGTSAAAAVMVALRALGSERNARAAAPFLALAPAVIWIAVSADALFAGVSAWAIALLALATRQHTGWIAVSALSGSAFGFALYLNYGLVLIAVPALAVLIARSLRPALPVALGMLIVVGAFTASGFWWLDGYHLVVQRYYQGIASERPYSYWVWGNLAATICALGLAPLAAAHRVAGGLHLPALWRASRQVADLPEPTRPEGGARALVSQGISASPAAHGGATAGSGHTDSGTTARTSSGAGGSGAVAPEFGSRTAAMAAPGLKARLEAGFAGWRTAVTPAALVAGAAATAVLLADLSGLSKAETERIWLPFDVWMLAGAALLPRRDVRVWLAVQAVGALLVNHFILTNW